LYVVKIEEYISTTQKDRELVILVLSTSFFLAKHQFFSIELRVLVMVLEYSKGFDGFDLSWFKNDCCHNLVWQLR
jgi:hypothetical protein